jgi:hypothetical protein
MCNKETGFFNTEQAKTIRAFNKDCDLELWEGFDKPSFLYFRLTQWIPESEMSDQEKCDFASYKTTGGYLKRYEYKDAFRASYEEASDEDKALLLALPNFDAAVFFEISGIDVNEISKKDKEIAVLEEQVKEMMKKIEELKK